MEMVGQVCVEINNVESGEIQRRQIKRAKLTEFFAKCNRSLVAMEACGSSHYWARTIRALGHEVKLLPAQHVKAFLLRDKTDAMDAKQIADRRRALEKASGGPVHIISGVSGKGLPDVLRALYATITAAAPVEESGPWQP